MKHTRIDAAIQDYEGTHTEALEMNAVIPAVANAVSKIENPHYQMQAMFWAANDYAARRKLIEQAHTQAFEEDDRWHWLEARHWVFWKETTPTYQRYELRDAHVEALKMDEEITFVREMESLTADQAMAYAEQWAYSNADIATQELMLERDHIEALSLNDKVDTDLAILRNDIKGFCREYTGTWLEEVIDYAIRHTFNRIVQVYGVEIHRDFFADLARTPEQKAFSGGMKTGGNTDITTPLRIISDYMQRFMRNNKDAKLSEAKQRLESKIVLLINDGYDEQHLRQVLYSATSSHSREAFLTAIKH